MVLILDTDSVTPGERAEALQNAASQNCSTSAATFIDPDDVQGRVHMYDFGLSTVLNIEASGTTLRRTPRMSRAMNECSIALALPVRATNTMSWQREYRAFGPRDLILVDLSSPYVYTWPDHGASYALHVDFETLGLPMEMIRTAAARLHTSPIYDLVREHVARITTNARALEGTAAAGHLGAATVELMHALVISAAQDEGGTDEALHATTATRVQSYVRLHLRDPELSPARIAAANGLSVRALFQIYASLGTSLEQSIIDQRLLGARSDLRSAARRHHAVATIAMSWGFTNPSHFSRRFREAFGCTPRDCRRGTVADSGPPAPGSTAHSSGRS
ncbi:helix-turn-helix domain-containing protein [Pseudonocardia sp. NPDC049635]|uniref:helix-turn-helix domain-containing protein n=1 Tax=Pseudonocardia sp. NPDC049635 TaxID=3155506 RepID=UPI0033E6FE39